MSPPTRVSRGTISPIRDSGQAKTSSDRTTRSARLPGSSEPRSASCRAAHAFHAVKARTASARVIRRSGCQPGSGPSRGRRVTAAWMPWNGLGSSTGKSEPPAMRVPVPSSERHAGEGGERVGGDQQEPAVVRVVGVARVQRGAARAERAVEPELQRADDEPPVALARGAALTPLGPRLLAAHRDVVAERKPPALEETPVRRERVEVGAHLVEAREPLRATLGDRLADGAVEALRGRRRQDGPDG